MNLNDTPSRGQLQESDLDAAIRESWPPRRASFPACTAQACHQGRTVCPCPEACRRPESEQRSPLTVRQSLALVDNLTVIGRLLIGAVLGAAAAAAFWPVA